MNELYSSAELLGQHYERVYSSPQESSFTPEAIFVEVDLVNEVNFEPLNLLDSIKEIRPKSLARHDGFSTQILRNCAEELSILLF